MPHGYRRDTDWRFATDRLRINTPFAGNNQRRVLDCLLQLYSLQHNLDPGFHAGLQEDKRSNPHSSSRSAARHLSNILAGQRLQHMGIVEQPFFQPLNHFRRRPFLRAEYSCRAARANQRIINVTGDVNATRFQPRIAVLQVDARKARQTPAPSA